MKIIIKKLMAFLQKKSKTKKIAFIMPKIRTTSSARFRVLQYLPYIRENGYECDLYFHNTYHMSGIKSIDHKIKNFHIFSVNLFKLFFLLLVNNYKVIFIHRCIFSTHIPVEVIFGLFFKNRMLVDFDDAVYLPRPKRYSYIIKSARRIIVGNNFLRNYAQKYHNDVWMIPTPVETRQYYPSVIKTKDTRKKVILGWIGSPSGLYMLETIYEPLFELSHKIDFELIIVSDFKRHSKIHISGVNIINKQWESDNELTDLNSFDIGLMPLIDNEWSKGKCSYKALQYMSVGIPTLASAVGNNLEVIEDGVDGFLYKDKKEFMEKCFSLAIDEQKRIIIGNCARRKIEQIYATNRVNLQLLESFRL